MSSFYAGKGFNQTELLMLFKKINTVPKATKVYNINSTFVSPIYIFSLAGNIIVYTPNQDTVREKYFIHIIYKGKMPNLAGKKQLSVNIFLHGPRLLSISAEKYGSNMSEMDTKLSIPAPTQWIITIT